MIFSISPQPHAADLSKFAMGLERIVRRFLILALLPIHAGHAAIRQCHAADPII